MSEHHRTSAWAKAVRENRPRIAASLPAPCIDCRRPVLATQRWQVGHRLSAAEARRAGWTEAQINAPANLGPTHTKGPGQKACNQIAGGKIGKAMQTGNKRDERRLPSW